MIPLIRKVQRKQINRDRKVDSRRRRVKEIGNDCQRVSFRGDENLLELDSGDGHTTL